MSATSTTSWWISAPHWSGGHPPRATEDRNGAGIGSKPYADSWRSPSGVAVDRNVVLDVIQEDR
ncbi:hypothetical protein ACWEWX_47780, partial [Streptomyces asiaticus]